MGSMSASDAAPLPRLGEVYFDVRGESRSMRLSWYADTGVAVFSIWQGGTCTGTFRLPIADLPRMVQALQRGPDGDSGGEAGQPAGQGRRGSPAPESQLALPDGDIVTGQEATVAHGPRSGRHHGGDRGPASHGGGPASEPSAEPSTGYRDELSPGYSGGRSASRHRDESTGEYGERPSAGYTDSGRSGGYRDEPGKRQAEGRRASGHRAAASYADEPTGVYRLEDDPYADGEAGDRYGQEATGPYREDSLPGSHRDSLPSSHHADSPGAHRDDSPPGSRSHRDDSLPGSHREDDLHGGYHDSSLPGGYRDDDLHGSHHDDDLHGGYHDSSLPGGYRDDSLPGGHQDEPARQYPGDRSRNYEREHTAAYSGGRYDEEPTGVYRGDLAHESYEDGRYAERGYPEDPLSADYPTGPSTLNYPGTGDARGYPPASSRDPGYSPARPYVAPQSEETGLPEEAVAHEPPRRSRSRRG